jgi:hypothetical protein
MIINAGFETAFSGGLPGAQWGKTSGATLVRNTSVPRTGAGCLEVQGTAGTDYGYFDVPVMAGEPWRFGEMWGRTTAGVGSVIIRGRNLHTGKWLKDDGTWQTAQQDLLASSSSSYVRATGAGNVDFTIEEPTSTMPREMTLRFFYYANGANGAFYDDCYIWPRNNFTSIHGHNIAQSVLVELVSGTSPGPTTVRATMTPRRPSFYSTFTEITDRYVTLRFTNSDVNPGGAIFIGEWVLASSRTLVRNPNYSIRRSFLDPQQREMTEAGPQRAFALTEGNRRRLRMVFDENSLAAFQDWRDVLVGGTRNGLYSCVLVPDDTDAEVAIFGKIQPEHAIDQDFLTHWSGGEIVLEEAPMFTVVP